MSVDRKLSAAEPVSQLRSVKIIECGEPLVSFVNRTPRLTLAKPRFTYRRETVARASLVDGLVKAAESLPAGYTLAIIEGWRPPYIQKRMYQTVWNRIKADRPDWSNTSLARLVNQFTAPMNTRVPPPHTTGGAVDLMLAGPGGEELDHSSPYKWENHAGYAYNAPGLTEEARKHRTILRDALVPAGITNYPSEFWHWTYGDQGWAYRGGHPNALYGAIEPEGWEPSPEDAIDAPLVFIEEPEES